jgi:hypothetical protein
VDHPGAGEVDVAVPEARLGAELGEPAAAPGPHAEDRVDDDRHPEAVDDERGELPAFGHGAGHDRRGGVHEHQVEQEVGHHPDVVDAVEGEPLGAEQPPAAEVERAGERVGAAEVGDVADAAEHQRVAGEPEAEDADPVDHEVGHHHVGGVLLAAEAGLHQREPGLHEHHQEAGDQRPGEVDGDLVLAGGVADRGRLVDPDVGRSAGDVATGIAGGRARGDLPATGRRALLGLGRTRP